MQEQLCHIKKKKKIIPTHKYILGLSLKACLLNKGKICQLGPLRSEVLSHTALSCNSTYPARILAVTSVMHWQGRIK